MNFVHKCLQDTSLRRFYNDRLVSNVIVPKHLLDFRFSFLLLQKIFVIHLFHCFFLDVPVYNHLFKIIFHTLLCKKFSSRFSSSNI